MGMISSVSVIFDTGATYLYYFNKGDFLNLEETMLPINLKGTEKGLAISAFGIVKYFVRSGIESMISLQAQAYYVPGSQKYLSSFNHKEFEYHKDTRVPSYLIVMMMMIGTGSLI